MGGGLFPYLLLKLECEHLDCIFIFNELHVIPILVTAVVESPQVAWFLLFGTSSFVGDSVMPVHQVQRWMTLAEMYMLHFAGIYFESLI